MPLYHREKVKDATIAYWKIEEPEEFLREKALQVEIERASVLKHTTKRTERLASRVLLGEVVRSLGIEYSGIQKDEFGKPWLAETPKMHISLAHQGEWAAVILHPRKSVGIDLETPSPKIDRIAPRLFSEKELHWADTPERRCMIWCAKEALYKWYGKRGLFFKEDLQIARFSLQNPLEAEVKGTAVQINTRRLQETQAVFCLAV